MTPEKLRQALRTVVGVVIGIAMFVLAIFFFAFFLAVAAIGIAILIARFWWLSRKLRRTGARAGKSSVLEGEYEVVREPPARDGQRLP